MATGSSILTWRIPRTEEPGGLYSPWGRKESDMTEQLSMRTGTKMEVFGVHRICRTPTNQYHRGHDKR